MKHTPVHLPPLNTPENRFLIERLDFEEDFVPKQNTYHELLSYDDNIRNEKHILILDIESSGYHEHNFMTQFAFSLFNCETRKLIDYFSCYMPFIPGHTWDPCCFDSFWRKNIELYKNTLYYMHMQHLSIWEIFAKLTKWIHFHSSTKDITIASDNPSFDVQWIDKYLPFPFKLCNITGEYKSILDTKSYIQGFAYMNPLANKFNVILSSYYSLMQHTLISDNVIKNQISKHLETQGRDHCALGDTIRLGNTILFFFKLQSNTDHKIYV
jgi:hypothetical protein